MGRDPTTQGTPPCPPQPRLASPAPAQHKHASAGSKPAPATLASLARLPTESNLTTFRTPGIPDWIADNNNRLVASAKPSLPSPSFSLPRPFVLLLHPSIGTRFASSRIIFFVIWPPPPSLGRFVIFHRDSRSFSHCLRFLDRSSDALIPPPIFSLPLAVHTYTSIGLTSSTLANPDISPLSPRLAPRTLPPDPPPFHDDTVAPDPARVAKLCGCAVPPKQDVCPTYGYLLLTLGLWPFLTADIAGSECRGEGRVHPHYRWHPEFCRPRDRDS